MATQPLNSIGGFSVGETFANVVDANSNVTANNFTVSGLSNLGSVSNITITGGFSGYILSTNGNGNLSWTSAGTVGVAGSNTQVQFNDAGVFGASANFTFNSSTNTLTVTNFSGNGSGLVSITGANVTGTVANANFATYSSSANTAATVTDNAQPNITSVGTLTSLSVSGNLTSGNLVSGNANLGNLATANFVNIGNDLSVNGNITSNGGYFYLEEGIIVVDSGNAGIFNTTIADINLGMVSNITMGSISGNATVRGYFTANGLATLGNTSSGNLSVSGNATITNLKVSDLYSNRTPVNVLINTVVDSFPVNKYRSAKYTMRVNSDDGYQAVEVLLIHDGTNSFVTVYGSLSTTGSDIIVLSTGISAGNVQLLATTATANTTVNLLGTYVAD